MTGLRLLFGTSADSSCGKRVSSCAGLGPSRRGHPDSRASCLCRLAVTWKPFGSTCCAEASCLASEQKVWSKSFCLAVFLKAIASSPTLQ